MNLSEIESHLEKFRVGIAGAGGLGSNCAALLARSGVGTLVIADYDRVEKSNLSRQFYFAGQEGMMKTEAIRENLARIRPEANVIIHTKKLDRKNITQIFRDCHVIVEALDSSEMKEMFIEIVQSQLNRIPLVAGSGIAGWGKNEILKTRKIDETLYVCGDETSEVTDDLPPLAPRVVIVAAKQANTVVELLMKMK
ncbi:MAG: sulfur carrier protein ThiS adenylyltransferase ThiF [Bacteroidales bacterium]|nr:sulfur carrier protein ThiS adenylyltransferase ThiF [Bacteroidales bacterium]